MLPDALDFDVSPRVVRGWLRLVLASATILVGGGMAILVLYQQRQIEGIESDVRDVDSQLASHAGPVMYAVSEPKPTWMAVAAQDGRSFELNADARLLEVERCTADTATVVRFTHDALANTTRMEALLRSPAGLVALTKCLSGGDGTARLWQVDNFNGGSAKTAPSAPAVAVLRHQ